jgi:tetratricopeptide (TPR) repeat protein
MRVSDRAARSALAGSFWARARVAELEPEYAVNRAAILSLGRSFRIVTRETSLIVLETIQDYVRFEVEPPKELLAEYHRMQQAMGHVSAPDSQQKIERVVAMLNEKENWWRRDFPKGRVIAPVQRRSESRDYRQGVEDRAAAVSGSLNRQLPASPRPQEDDALRAQTAPSVRARSDDKREAEAKKVERSKAANLIAEPDSSVRILGKDYGMAAAYSMRLRAAASSELYRIYLDERPGYSESPVFFIDAADLLYAKGQPELALRVLSNLAELDLENRQTLRTLGHKLMEIGEGRLAVIVFKKVQELSPEEPQSFRDLGLAYAAVGDHQRAVDTLYEVVLRPWHNRFPEIELIALADLNTVAARKPGALDLRRIDPRLLRNLPVDVRAVLTWDADNTDVNLAVTDPNGQVLYPGGGISFQGGRMSQNYSGGYGPEEYSLRKAKPGKYQFVAHFAGQRQQFVGGGSTYAHLRVYTRFGNGAQTERSYGVHLARAGVSVTLAEIDVPGKLEDD